MTRHNLIVAIALLGTSWAVSVHGKDTMPSMTDQEVRAMVSQRAIDAVNEISQRRRLNRFFPNYQHPNHGFLVDVVNSRRGNLTFLNRDLVAVADLPIVFGRVYDSTITNDLDGFGKGWKITLTESLRIDNNELVYTDANHSRYKMRVTPSGAIVSGDDSPGLNGRVTGERVVLTGEATTRTFFVRRGVGRLERVEDKFGNLVEFEYVSGRLVSVQSSSGLSIKIGHTEGGLISDVAASDGRSLSFDYNDKDQLESVVSNGRTLWSYHYDKSERLATVIDANGVMVLRVRYSADGKVSHVEKSSELRDFRYSGVTTFVDRPGRGESAILHSESGRAIGHIDPFGNEFRLSTRGGARRGVLELGGAPIVRYSESIDGKLRTFSAMRNDGEWDAAVLKYDKSGRLREVARSSSDSSTFRYYRNGLLRTKSTAEGTANFRWSRSGRLTAVGFDGEETVDLESNDSGLVTAARYRDGNEVRFHYDDRNGLEAIEHSGEGRVDFDNNEHGFRQAEKHSLGDLVEFSYDANGNLTSHSVTRSDETVTDIYHLGDWNELKSISSSSGSVISFEYDELGSVRDVSVLDRSLHVDYDRLRRISEITVDGNSVYKNDYADDPFLAIGEIQAADSRTFEIYLQRYPGFGVFGSKTELIDNRAVASDYPLLKYDADKDRIVVLPLESLEPDYLTIGSLNRRQLLVSANDEHAPNLTRLLRPSNVLFIPPEYRSVNCLFCNGVVIAHAFTVNGSGSPSLNTGQVGTFDSSATTVDCDGTVTVETTYGDGASDLKLTFGPLPSASESHAYTSAGSYTAESLVTCVCSIFAYSFESLGVNVAPAPTPITIRLTFDDGPTSAGAHNSRKVITALGIAGIESTFFVQTHVPNRGGHPQGIVTMNLAIAGGSNIMVHTGSDADSVRHTIRVGLPPYAGGANALESDLIRAKSRIAGLAGGAVPPYVRAVEGVVNAAVLATYADQGLVHKLWDVDSGDSTPGADFASISAQLTTQLTAEVLSGNTDIVILFHDIHARTADNMAAYIALINQLIPTLGNYTVEYEKL